MMYKVIVTGATSFIGIHLIKQLIYRSKYFVYAIVRRNSGKRELLPKSDRVMVIELDMEEYTQIGQVIATPCDACFMLAWNGTRGDDRNDSGKQQLNYQYSMECIMHVCLLGCKKIISAGSQAE